MKAYLILEDGTVFTGTSIGSQREVISEIVFNTSMTGYLEVLTDPSYAGQAVVMTYPLIGNYGICRQDMESLKPWPDGYIVRELSRIPSNFRCEDTIQNFLEENDIPDIIERFKNLDKEKDRKRTDKSFMVPKQDIVDNDYDLSINKYKEIEYIPVEYPPTIEIMTNIRELEMEIGKEMDELEKLLGV